MFTGGGGLGGRRRFDRNFWFIVAEPRNRGGRVNTGEKFGELSWRKKQETRRNEQ